MSSPYRPPPPPLLSWGSTQGHILTGGGRLNENFLPGRDFVTPDDLPHTIKSKGLIACRQQYRTWLREGKRDPESGAVGAWCRPLFSGGWAHSASADTAVFNLQTPSIFIDLRFPLARLERRKGYYGSSLEDCTMEKLRELSRQHCFAGYSIVDRADTNGGSCLPVCTRHHALDWNFHPRFPRSRPNKWRIEAHPSGDGSQFKEWGYATEPRNGQAIYMERWALLPEIRSNGNGRQFGSKGPWLALRALDTDIDAFLVVVGDHFAFARDRLQLLPDFEYSEKGGCSNLADDALQRGDRNALASLISMEGSYGHLHAVRGRKWTIKCSTWPWREGHQLIETASTVWHNSVLKQVCWDGAQWEVLENTFSRQDIENMFSDMSTSKL